MLVIISGKRKLSRVVSVLRNYNTNRRQIDKNIQSVLDEIINQITPKIKHMKT